MTYDVGYFFRRVEEKLMTAHDFTTEKLLSLTDSLGDEFMSSFSATTRRATGSTYTPIEIVNSMILESAREIDPEYVVDCGCGSGRFALAAAMMFPKAKVYAVDNSSLACTMCSENVRRYGFSDRIEVVNASFLDFSLPRGRGKTLWIGNPPYVRHHNIAADDKKSFKSVAGRLDLPSSCLAGLHIHFLAHIADLWQSGDFGLLITSAEWMDVNYGNFARKLLTTRLPIAHMRLFDRSVRLFEGTDSTAVVFSFSDMPRDVVAVTLPDGSNISIPLEVLNISQKWSRTIDCVIDGSGSSLEGMIPLGSLASVHRGVVTGNNKFWVRSAHELAAFPEELSTPIVAHAREIMDGCVAKGRPDLLGRLITLPVDLGTLSGSALTFAEKIVAEGSRHGIDKGYVAGSRRAWWSVQPPSPPAIMMTYMSRKNPTFIRNDLGLPMLNVVHGIYPKRNLSDRALDNLVDYLNTHVNLRDGRVYCGGLAKFEPKEAEAILVPCVEQLEA